MGKIFKLKERKLKDGRIALWIYTSINGKRYCETLGLYLMPGDDKLVKKQNKATREAAEMILAERMLDYSRELANLPVVASRTMPISEYVEEYIKRHRLAKNTITTFHSAVKQFISVNGDARLGNITVESLCCFVEHMHGSVSANSATSYYRKINTLLRTAAKQGLIKENPCDKLDLTQKPKEKRVRRAFLTLDELRRLAEADCPNPVLKQAFMFACFTGLRISDIKALRWGDINDNTIIISQTKTQEPVAVPVSDNARKWLPKRKGQHVFNIGKMDTQNSRDLNEWVKNAGIDKHVTFHVSRHTFACLLIRSNVDLYVVSRLLGHTNIATTQIYADLMDEQRKEAVNLIPTL